MCLPLYQLLATWSLLRLTSPPPVNFARLGSVKCHLKTIFYPKAYKDLTSQSSVDLLNEMKMLTFELRILFNSPEKLSTCLCPLLSQGKEFIRGSHSEEIF